VQNLKHPKPVPTAYPAFNPIVYTIENVLPVVKLAKSAPGLPTT
jgi:hypothetical protein